MQKQGQIVVRIETTLIAEIDRIVAEARKRWGLGVRDGYYSRPTRSAVVRRLLIRSLDEDQRVRALQKDLSI